jgi:hypothetical protein
MQYILTHQTNMKTKKRKRLDYMRGYRAGRRNLPFSMLTPNFDCSRGWGAGQDWLRRKIES